MDSRRDFIRKSILLSGAAGISMSLPPSIQKALAIDPAPGSTYLDAEHVVILMQENRSFDHCFGTLRGVRGYNDPRAFQLPNGNPVWLQTNAEGKSYLPFRLRIHDTKATWMGDLPHSRTSQVDAHNQGQHDNWLTASHLRDERYTHIPFTMGYYNREDLPFNYAMADAFTVCDQNFSSAMTSTWPNRHYMWSGNIRRTPHDAKSRAHIRNDLEVGEADWITYPERLEAEGVSWKIYQNDLTAGGGFSGEERSWLTNFTCNTLEYFSQYNVKFSARYFVSLQEREKTLQTEIQSLEEGLKTNQTSSEREQKLRNDLAKKREVFKQTQEELVHYTREKFVALTPVEKSLYRKAFSTNEEDPDYRSLEPFTYREGNEEYSINLPKGDVLYQFRKDVNAGSLPSVSWLVSSQKFSDHPSAPWYGTWMVSEILNILTDNPDVWKKTIFILTYDENDGYYDHIPPFLPPNPQQVNPGKCSDGIDTQVEYIPLEQELEYSVPAKSARGGQIGLGYRVPMIIASPWTRGGRVNSQVFDHTSTLQFLEGFLEQKFGKEIKEDNISAWRRTICGDLTSVFTRFQPKGKEETYKLEKEPTVKRIFNAQFQQVPNDYQELSAQEIEICRVNPHSLSKMPRQEPGTRPSCALPYQLYVDGAISNDGKRFELQFQSSNELFGNKAAGAPFTVYTTSSYRPDPKDVNYDPFHIRYYAISAGDSLTDDWNLSRFKGGNYALKVHGPNGFYRSYKGSLGEPYLNVICDYQRKSDSEPKLNGNLMIKIHNSDPTHAREVILESGYQKGKQQVIHLKANETKEVPISLKNSHRWYDIRIKLHGSDSYEQQFAGRIETGEEGLSDPLVG